MRFLAALLAVAVLAFAPLPTLSADVPYGVFVDGRPLDALGKSGLSRNGTTYVNVVRAVKAFNGLLTFGTEGVSRVTIGKRTMAFTLGHAAALLDGMAIRLPGAPFLENGDTYVPLSTIATLGGAKLQIQAHARRASLLMGRGEGFPAPAPTLDPSLSDENDDVQPSPMQALSFTTSASSDAAGLHARLEIRNTTAHSYTIAFPAPVQVAFIVMRNGSEVWNSSSESRAGDASKLTIAPHGTKTVSADNSAFARLGAGRYTLYARLMTLIPLDIPPISLGVSTPAPAPVATS